MKDFDYTFQLLDFEQDLYAEAAKAYLCLYSIKDQVKFKALEHEIQKLEAARMKMNMGFLNHVTYANGKPQYDSSFTLGRERCLRRLQDTLKTTDEILSIIYAIQGKVWEPKKEQIVEDAIIQEEEKKGFHEPEKKEVTATGRQAQ